MADISYFLNVLSSSDRADELTASGAPVVGGLCNFVPEEIVLALGAAPVRLCAGDHVAARRAEEILPRDSCPVVKATVGLMERQQGLWGAIDLLVVPTSCDVKAKLPDVLGDSSSVHTLLLPRSKSDDGARQLWLRQVWEFGRRMEQLTGRKLTANSLRRAIDLLNARQEAARRLLEVRKAASPPISGEETLIVLGASFYDDP
ncbi:MAG: 2-hydroxyacyl-CoA dehydratase subunit D, partial [Armatimonadota bacterium]